MKAFGIACAAACAAVAIALPNWQNQLHAEDYAYPMPQYAIKDAQLKDNLKFAGCKPVKLDETAQVVLYDDLSMSISRGSDLVSGEWALVNGQFFFNFDNSGRATLLGYKNPLHSASNINGLYEDKGMESCKAKNPATTRQQIIAPSVAVTKNAAKVNAKTQLATYTIQMKGSHTTDAKINKKTGQDFIGAFSAKTVIKGQISECDTTTYCDLPGKAQ